LPFQDYLSDTRRMLMVLLEASNITDGTKGTCLYACILLEKTLNQFEREGCAMIRGGDGEGDGGYRDDAGDWHGHFWVEATDSDGQGYILDVTADQFGGSETVCLRLDEPSAARYRNGDQTIVDEQVSYLMQEMSRACSAQFGCGCAALASVHPG